MGRKFILRGLIARIQKIAFHIYMCIYIYQVFISVDVIGANAKFLYAALHLILYYRLITYQVISLSLFLSLVSIEVTDCFYFFSC